ncbi:MAG: hypothetical protein ACR2NZ_10055, partial [Rubripirellula sp.]
MWIQSAYDVEKPKGVVLTSANQASDDDSSSVTPQVVRWVGLLVFALALLLRAGICVNGMSRFTEDPDAYRAIAETIGNTGVYGLTGESGTTIATAYRPPLYPWVLSWLLDDGQLTNQAVAMLHALLGAIAAWFTFLAAVSMFDVRGQGSVPVSRRRLVGAATAAILVAVDPILLRQSTLLMTETMAA